MEKNTWRRGVSFALILGMTIGGSAFSGCKMEIEATDNTVSASVDGDTTEKVDSILDWIKARIQRLFNGEEVTTNSTTAPTTVSPSSQA